jgi:hypothetical protein
MDCWEFKGCEFHAGGKFAGQHGVCPAYPHRGRHCARVAGTMCEGELQGGYARKLARCLSCDFYRSEHYDRSYGGFAP